MSQIYQSRHGRRKARRVAGGAAHPRAYIPHHGISSQGVVIILGGLAVLDGFLSLLIGLR
jgi:hypothetical protein